MPPDIEMNFIKRHSTEQTGFFWEGGGEEVQVLDVQRWKWIALHQNFYFDRMTRQQN